jgi:hypothetical protein
LDAWLSKRDVCVPGDLKQVWLETGGGVIFECETILGPFGNRELGENIDLENEPQAEGNACRLATLSHWFRAFGGGRATGEYACLREGSYEVAETFGFLAEWYAMIRAELASRYGLS